MEHAKALLRGLGAVAKQRRNSERGPLDIQARMVALRFFLWSLAQDPGWKVFRMSLGSSSSPLNVVPGEEGSRQATPLVAMA
eukprot:9217744-Pyramimonas_sp.AAC.1